MKQSLLLAIEIQQARLKTRDDQILHLKQLLAAAIKDRDEAQHNCKKALLDKLLLQHHLKQSHQSSDPNSALSSVDGDDCDGSIVSAPLRLPPPPPETESRVAIKGPLPEKGQLLQAVRNAGPLLETLLLAGPLPQWRHPPPAVDPYTIPLVVPEFLHENGNKWSGRKRGAVDGFDRSEESKHQRNLMLQWNWGCVFSHSKIKIRKMETTPTDLEYVQCFPLIRKWLAHH